MKNILLIGNGFDRAHNLKTSYKEFLDSTIKSVESGKKSELFQKIIQGTANGMKPAVRVSNTIIKDINSNNSNFWYDIESAYFSALKKTKIPVSINKELNNIKKELCSYLKDEDKTSNPIPGLDLLFKFLKATGEVHAINFNYTSTLRHYSNYLNSVIPIHGSLDDVLNPIIFGFAADDKDVLDLLGRNDNGFIENIKQYNYICTTNLERVYEILEPSYADEVINVFLMGLSCGLSDSMILNEILGNKNVKNIFNCFYKGIEDHKTTLININRTTNPDIGFKKYRAFPRCIRMPQHNKELTISEVNQFSSSNNNEW